MVATHFNISFEHFPGDNENTCFARLQTFNISMLTSTAERNSV